jgi:hypothetical protein
VPAKTNVTQLELEATCQQFEMQLVACGGAENAGTSSIMVKLKCDGSTSWTVFHKQFEAAQEKAKHLLAILLGHAADILHSVPAGAT